MLIVVLTMLVIVAIAAGVVLFVAVPARRRERGTGPDGSGLDRLLGLQPDEESEERPAVR